MKRTARFFDRQCTLNVSSLSPPARLEAQAKPPAETGFLPGKAPEPRMTLSYAAATRRAWAQLTRFEAERSLTRSNPRVLQRP